jgi:hypothetical protein
VTDSNIDGLKQIAEERNSLSLKRHKLILDLKDLSSQFEDSLLKQCIDALFQVHFKCEKATEGVSVFAQEAVKKYQSKVLIQCMRLRYSDEIMVTISLNEIDNEVLALLDRFSHYKSEMSKEYSLIYYFPSTVDLRQIGMEIAKDFLKNNKDVSLFEDGESVAVEIK